MTEYRINELGPGEQADFVVTAGGHVRPLVPGYVAEYEATGIPPSWQQIAEGLAAERDQLAEVVRRYRRVVQAAQAWRKRRNFEYRPGEINPHLLTAHQEDLDLARAVDALAADQPDPG